MRKIIQLLLVAIVAFTAITLATSVNAATGDATELIVHYKRFDNNETNYHLWLWPDGGSGADYYFTSSDEYGAVATISLSGTTLADADSIGILVFYEDTGGTWIKDVDQDRYIDMTQPNSNGEVNAYVLTGETFISYVSVSDSSCDLNDPDPYHCAQTIDEGLLDVYFDESYNIQFSATGIISSSNITIEKNGVSIPFSGFTSGQEGTLTLSETVDLTNTYTFILDWNDVHNEKVIRLNADYDSEAFQTMYNYDGELGAIYTASSTTFKVWAPVSSRVQVNLYHVGHTTSDRSDGEDSPYATYELDYDTLGVWDITIFGDLNGVYYTFNVYNDGAWATDIQDPYGMTFGLNGQRAMVIDMDSVDATPDGWDSDTGNDGYTNPNNAIIYELHVRDLTTQDTWGGPANYAGTYLGFTVEDTSYTNPYTGVTVSTGLAHLIELGITHVHLLPTYDQDWNDEADMVYNWGYNPQNYNSPEGGYSTDPYDGFTRVYEYREMVMALHENGINVINDVVYNHTGPGLSYSFNRIVPGYIYRYDSSGNLMNGTGVGNETASERYMWSKFMTDSVVYWAEEYHIDGFRFDLMAIHDYVTMETLSDALETLDPDIFVYGEPWGGGGTIGLDYYLQAGKNNLGNMPLVAAFNDSYRNAIKGSSDGSDGGYIVTGTGIYDIMKGLKGSIGWNSTSTTSSQSINYVTAHDNLTLYDKLNLVNGSSGYTETIDYEARLANSIVLLSQGIPFLAGGVEFLRTKGGNSNSYDASDSVNWLSWVRKSNYLNSFEYYKGMIAIRKEFDSFKMTTSADINANLTFLYPDGYGLIGMHLTKNGEDIYVYFNSNNSENEITLPSGAWKLLANRDAATLDGLGTFAGTYPISKSETLIFVPGNTEDIQDTPVRKPEISNTIVVMYEGGTLTITSPTDIYSYNVDSGSFIELATPAKSVAIDGLTVGRHTIIIKNSSGVESSPFTITILEQNIVITTPSITNSESEITSDISFVLTTDEDVVAYRENGGDWVTISPSSAISIGMLIPGTYIYEVQNADGSISDSYTLVVTTASQSCEENPDQDIRQVDNTNLGAGAIIAIVMSSLTVVAAGVFVFFKFKVK